MSTRDQILQAIAQHFPSEQSATVLGILAQYGPARHHRERDRVHLAIVQLSRGDLEELRMLVGHAQRDYRDVLYWTELTRGSLDSFAGRFTEALLTPDATPARLALVKESVPRASRIAVLWHVGYRSHDAQLTALAATARDLGVVLVLEGSGVRHPTELGGAFGAMQDGRADAMLVLTSTMLQHHWADIAERARASRLPAMGELREFAAAGGLLSYGPSAATRREQAVAQMGDVVKTLKGQSSSERPDTRSNPMELVVNLKTANVLGLTIPPSLLARADELIR
jgi:hypothetical protein